MRYHLRNMLLCSAATESGLAAIHAAAGGAVSNADHEAAISRARAEGHAAGVTEGKAAGIVEGATAERERILGIEAIAAPGHEELIAKAKADGKTTPDQAAGAILRAEKETRGKQMTAVAGVEKETGKIDAAPTAGGKTPAETSTAKTPDAWKAEYAASEKLQSEFASAEDYVAVCKAEASGRVRVLGARPAAA